MTLSAKVDRECEDTQTHVTLSSSADPDSEVLDKPKESRWMQLARIF